jgi:hypothetical protein
VPRGPHRQGNKPADPSLEQGREQEVLRPFGLPRWAGALLYAAFWFLLAIPLVRRWRRRPWWNAARAALGLVALAPFAMWAARAESPGAPWLLAGGFLALFAALCGPTADPDRERKLQRRHRAQYLLNGGAFAGGRLPSSEPLTEGAPLYLLIRGEHLLLIPRRGTGEVHSAFDIRRMLDIRVGGERYVPIYISEAKDPPVKETMVDRKAAVDLELMLEDGNVLRLCYRGAFRKHLAETAAHAIHSVRERLLRPQPAELARIVNSRP